MDNALKSAIATWDNFVKLYPDNMINKKFLTHNTNLVRSLIDTVVPKVMANVVELEDRYADIADAYETQTQKYVADILSLSGIIQVTSSCVATLVELESMRRKLAKYGILLETDTSGFVDQAGDSIPPEEIKSDFEFVCGDDKTPRLSSPLWLICAILPNEALSVHLLSHLMYSKMTANNAKVKIVSLSESPLMAESEEVADLLDSLDA